MKSIYSCMACAMVAQLLTANLCSAQTATELKAAPAGVTVDGDAKEWGDMAFTDAKTNLAYTLANDKDNLYLVIKTKDPVQISSILGAGVTFGVDPKGKKRTTSTSFPIPPGEDNGYFLDMKPPQIKQRAESARYGKIGVNNFKDISDENILTTNNLGIQVSTGYDAEGNLVYEEVIPITLFHAADLIGKEWTYNIKINPLQGKQHMNNNGVKKVNLIDTKKTTVNPVGGDVFSKDVGGGIMDLTPGQNLWGKFILAKAQ